MSLLNTAADLFIKHMSSGAGENLQGRSGDVVSALGGLFGADNGELDLGSLLENFSGRDLAPLAQSWLSDDGNADLGIEQLMGIFGGDKLSGFASNLGLDEGATNAGLASMIPDLIDQNSQGGALLGALAGGGGKGILGAVGKLFGR